jgi:hypothetical protein
MDFVLKKMYMFAKNLNKKIDSRFHPLLLIFAKAAIRYKQKIDYN